MGDDAEQRLLRRVLGQGPIVEHPAGEVVEGPLNDAQHLLQRFAFARAGAGERLGGKLL